MAKSHGSTAKVYLNGYDLTSFLQSISPSAAIDVADASVLGDVAKENITGLSSSTVSLEGLFAGAAAEIDPILAAIVGGAAGSAILTHLPTGDAIGNASLSIWGALTAYGVTSSVSDVNKVKADMTASAGFEAGVVLHVLQAEAAGGNSTSVDNAASSASGGVGFLHVVSGTTLVGKVQHSVDNSSWADLITFTSASARGAQRVAVAGTVNRYVRALWTEGASSTFAIQFRRL